MTSHELDQLEKETQRPDYGAKYFKPGVVLTLIAEIRMLKTVYDGLKRFAYEEAPKIAADKCTKQTDALKAEVEHLRSELRYIANAKKRSFESDGDFRLWAQNRARHAIGEKPRELSVKKEKP